MVDIDPETRARITAEASVWLVRLQGDERTPEMQAAFEAWQAATPHAGEIFARVRTVWDLLPEAEALTSVRPANDHHAPPSRRLMISAAACLIAAVGTGWYLQTRTQVYETAVGQRQAVVLSDGSRVSLNTDSRISVSYSLGRRHIVFERGEAQFDVSHDANRPFTVQVEGEEVRALGTAFIVRRDPEAVAVTLIKGRVQISAVDGSARPGVVLSPGERAVARGGASFVVDRPSLEAVMAWQRGEVIFSNASLAEAARELNRYSRIRLVLADDVAALRVSGVFEAANPSEFAQSMAQLNGLKVTKARDEIRLAHP